MRVYDFGEPITASTRWIKSMWLSEEVIAKIEDMRKEEE